MCTFVHPVSHSTLNTISFVSHTSALLDYITSGPVVAFEIVGENAVNAWREAIGPTDPSEARRTAPTSIRAQYGTGLCSFACLWPGAWEKLWVRQ